VPENFAHRITEPLIQFFTLITIYACFPPVLEKKKPSGNIFSPAPARESLPLHRIDPEYKRLRLQVFLGIFSDYAGYYLVRKNFSLVMPDLIAQGMDHGLKTTTKNEENSISRRSWRFVNDRLPQRPTPVAAAARAAQV
jgi:hypothetical protein